MTNSSVDDASIIMGDGPDVARLYLEAHITLSPLTEREHLIADELASAFGFRLAKLLMVKDRAVTEERSNRDTFMTGHGKTRADLLARTAGLIDELKKTGFKVWRYKIEDTLLDSRHDPDMFDAVHDTAPDKQRGTILSE